MGGVFVASDISGNEKGGTKKEGRKERRRKELLSAAWELFGEKGFDATTIDDITQGVGVSHGTFYVYFSSKEEVLQQLGQELLEDMLAFARDMLSRKEFSPQERLFRMVKHLLAFHEGQEFRMDLHNIIHRKMHDRLVEEGRRLFLPLVISLLREGVASGQMHLSHPEETAVFLVMLLAELEHSMDLWKDAASRQRAGKALRELLIRTLGGEDHVFPEPLL